MRDSERSDTGATDDSERSEHDQSPSQDNITTAPEPGAAPSASAPLASGPPRDGAPPGDGAPPAADAGDTVPAGEAVQPDGEAGKPKKQRRRPSRRLLALAGLVIAGLAALGGGVFGLVWAFTRTPTPAQVTAAGARQSAQQWRWLDAGKIFPATVSYKTTQGASTRAALVGIAPQAPCPKALDKATAKTVDKSGCETMLRATYADQSGTVLATVGVAVMKSESAANVADSNLDSSASSGLYPVAFPGTVSGAFSAQGREVMSEQATGRYLIFSVTGFADGRKSSPGSASSLSVSSPESDLTTALTDKAMDILSAPSKPCTSQEVRCQP